MARPFDERRTPSQYTGSSFNSQISLPGARARNSANSGQTWSSKRGTTKSTNTQQGSSVTKIKSSWSPVTTGTARKASSHGRLHKRGNSDTSSQTPDLSSQLEARYPSTSIDYRTIMASAGSDPYSLPPSSSVSKSKVKIKPLLRKLTPQEQTSIDLSRSAAENEGLGIYNSSEFRRGYHHRTTSGTSQMSTNTSSSNHRYGTHYVHPMRQTPRPYTPPIAASYQNSVDSEPSVVGPMIISSEGNQFEITPDAPTHYASLAPTRRIPPPLHLGPSKFTLTSTSQINLPGTPSSLRRQTDSINTSETMPQTARSSLESAFRKRTRTNTQPDPETQLATVQALRQKFNEKEAAKDLKFQQAEKKALEKEARRKEKRDEEERRKSESKERKRAKSNTTSEKLETATLGAAEHPPSEAPFEEETFVRPGQQRRGPTEKAGVAGKAVQGQWSLFWYKFRTMWLKLKRKMSRSST